MLVLSRKRGGHIVIGEGPDQIIVTVLEIRDGKVRMGFTAGSHVAIHRAELVGRPGTAGAGATPPVRLPPALADADRQDEGEGVPGG